MEAMMAVEKGPATDVIGEAREERRQQRSLCL